MFTLSMKRFTGFAAVSLFAVAVWAQTPKTPQYKDQGEYEVYSAATKEKDPQKQLDLLNQWEQKYAESDYKSNRAIMTAQALSQIAAKGAQPGASAADLDAGQKAAQQLLNNLDTYLAAENKPAAVTEDAWKQAHQTTQLQGLTWLAAIATAKKDDATAEAQYRKVLGLIPDSAATSYQLGTLIIRQRKPERYPEALFEIARALAVTGPNALAPAGKKSADDYLSKAYSGYHGDTSGLDDLKKAAAQGPFPPSGFTIESVTDIEKKKEGDAAAFAAANPDIALWRTIHDGLTGEGGDKYFADGMKGSEVPGGQNGVTMFRAKVVSQPSPKELLVSVDSAVGDATLQFENPLKGTIEAGTAIKFKGVPDTFVKDPYMITFTDLGKADVEGLPATAFAGTPAPAKKRQITKKK